MVGDLSEEGQHPAKPYEPFDGAGKRLKGGSADWSSDALFEDESNPFTDYATSANSECSEPGAGFSGEGGGDARAQSDHTKAAAVLAEIKPFTP